MFFKSARLGWAQESENVLYAKACLPSFSNPPIHMEDSTQLTEIPRNTCFCRKSFVLTSAYNNHLRKCPSTKRRVLSGLARAKELWEAKKNQKTLKLSPHLSTPQHELTGHLVLF